MVVIHHHFTAVCINALIYVLLAQGNVQLFVEDVTLAHRVFTLNILFQLKNSGDLASLTHCAGLCENQGECMAFTYVEQTPGFRLCQGHAVMMTPAMEHHYVIGARTFIRTTAMPAWLNTTCEVDADCVNKIPESELYPPGKLPICYKKRCLCSLAYFYSVSQRLCVQECPNSNLQESYSMYPVSGISGYNHYVFYGNSSQCQKECAAISDCENFETDGTRCNGARVSGGEVTVNTNDVGWNYYVRNCA